MEMKFDEELAKGALEDNYEEAEEMISDEDKVERLLQRMENKLKKIPRVGDILAILPIFISLIRSYITKEYEDIPIGSVIAILSTIIYVASPVDIIPDFIPGAGYLDDAAVVAACISLVKSDVDEYVAWREANGKTIDV